jgi:Flp pilus assembly protein TadD
MHVRGGGARAFWLAALLLPFGAGCAAHHGGLASRFVKPGTPSVSLDDPASTRPQQGLQEFARKVRALQSHAVTKSSLLPSIETQNAAIQKGLLLLAMRETPEGHVALAYAYKAAGVTDYALKHFQRAAVMEPCSAAAYDGMARVWRDSGLPGLALGDAYRGVHCDPAAPEVYNTLGTVFIALGQEKNAREAFQHALALSPRAGFALNNMCYMELVAGHLSEAERLCRASAAADPSLAASRNNLAVLQVLRGDVAGAEAILAGAGAGPDAQYNLGVLRFASGTFAEAADAFDAAAAHPGMRSARKAADQARAAAKALEQSHDER